MNEPVKTNNQKIAEQVKIYSAEDIAIIKSTVAKNATDLELSYFLNVAKSYNLNPFKKEIWCYKDGKNNLIVFAGRDGFLTIAQRSPLWNGIASCEVRKGDDFKMDVAQGQISHSKNVFTKGEIMGAYAICKPKRCEIMTIEWADFETYNKGYNVWKADPVAMIKKVAESHCLAKAYGISGLANEDDFVVKDDIVIVKDHESEVSRLDIIKASELIRSCTGDEDYKDIMERKISDPDLTGTELENIFAELRMNQPHKY